MNRFSIGSKYRFCPNGNYWQDISSIFDESIYLFCNCKGCKGKVYQLRSVDVTKKIKNETIERAIKMNEIDELKDAINSKNFNEVKEFLVSKGYKITKE